MVQQLWKTVWQFLKKLNRVNKNFTPLYLRKLKLHMHIKGASQVAQWVKNLPAMQETWVWYPNPGQEDPLEEGMATHSNTPAWRIPWTEEPGGLQSIGSQGIRQDWSDWACIHPHEYKNFYMSIILTLFLIVKKWKQSKCQSTDDYINIVCYIHTKDYYSPIKAMKYWFMLQYGRTLKVLWQVKEVRHKSHILYDFIYLKCPE